MDNFNYDLIFIGAGPATLGALLKLVKLKNTANILVIEKGKDLTTRQPNEVVNGVGGAGVFSDGKISSSLSTGGIIPNLKESKLNKYENELLSTLNKFTGSLEELKWGVSGDFDTSGSSLKFDLHKVCHMGTERSREIFKQIESYLLHQPNIHFSTETEVKNVRQTENGSYWVEAKSGTTTYFYNTPKIIIATGQKNKLPGIIMQKFNIKTVPCAIQLGVRVEDILNPQYKDIIKANYDFKFVKEYSYPDNIKVRVRTFCCNSGNAHTCAEKNSEGFICFNGHAFKAPDPTNKTVNYGIMCEVEGLKDFTKPQQIKLMQDINNLSCWKEDNFSSDGDVKPKRKLLKGFPQLKGMYPDEVIISLEDFVNELNKLVDLSKAKYLYPEVKLNEGCKPVLTKGWETTQKGIYMLGDCTSYTRGIIKAFIAGFQFAENI